MITGFNNKRFLLIQSIVSKCESSKWVAVDNNVSNHFDVELQIIKDFINSVWFQNVSLQNELQLTKMYQINSMLKEKYFNLW